MLHLHPAWPAFLSTGLSVWLAGWALRRRLRRYELAPRPLDSAEKAILWCIIGPCGVLVCLRIVPPGDLAAGIVLVGFGFLFWPPLAHYIAWSMRWMRVLPAAPTTVLSDSQSKADDLAD